MFFILLSSAPPSINCVRFACLKYLESVHFTPESNVYIIKFLKKNSESYPSFSLSEGLEPRF